MGRPPSTRRSALRAAASSIATAVAGCVTSPGRDTGRTRSPETARSPAAAATEAVPPGAEPPTSTPELAPVTAEDFAFDVAVRDQFTEKHPARLEVSLENLSDQTVTIDSPTSPFPAALGEHVDLDAGLRLVPFDKSRLSTVPSDARWVPREPRDRCWTVDYSSRVVAIRIRGELPPGEPIASSYTLLDHDEDRCLPPGTYEFSHLKRTTPGGFPGQNGSRHGPPRVRIRSLHRRGPNRLGRCERTPFGGLMRAPLDGGPSLPGGVDQFAAV